MQKQINPKKGVKLRFEATSWLPAKFSSQNNLLDHCNNNVLSLFTQGLLWDSSKEEQGYWNFEEYYTKGNKSL